VIVVVDQQGHHLSTVRVGNNPAEVMAAVNAAGPNPEVVVEATFGWCWLVDLLQEMGCGVDLASPSQLNWTAVTAEYGNRATWPIQDSLL
jgi:hypothetical protein